ncbi:transposase, MuDR, MULE transposase domain protein [Tanacetum coccineum]|uniref:Transposase, MuDR, MULE transposase domain protein n=1 Tax=Tanacetum coccineum TaxID=301880 RepID=A0ABQ4XLZ2_9ASTR
MASNIKNFKCLIHYNETQRGSILSEYLTYSKLHEMVMQKFNLEANDVINLSFKLSSFDSVVDITDDAEQRLPTLQNEPHFSNPESSFDFRSNEYNTDDVVNENPQNKIHKWQKFMSFEPDIPETPVYKAKPNISKQYSQQSEVEKGKIFDNKESLILAVRLKALSEDSYVPQFLRPVLMIDAVHLKGLYKGTNLVVVAMDGNNQIVPIGFGICKGETGPCWHAAIALAVEKEFPLAFHAIGQQTKWQKKMKSATWVVKGVNAYQYEVFDGQYIREVNLQTGICGCRKWQLSGLPCGHVIAITRFLGLTDCVHYVADWFKKPKYQATYSESIHSLGNMQQWEFPENIQKAIPPRMDNP